MRTPQILGAAAAVVLLVACAKDCTDIGCISGVAIEVPLEIPVAKLPVEVTACAEGECTTSTITASQAAPGRDTFGVGPSVSLTGRRERDVDVSLVVRSVATGEAIAAGQGVAHVVRSQPNGSGCGPVCFGARLRYDAATHRLVTL
ncbi:MAG: hypothetical protein AB7L13_19945 [Acidimicrobiia bacterium]